MANLKKEVMNLISRFDAAQEAFTANSAELKSLQKKHKKELKAAKADAQRYRVEVEALKAEMAILKMAAPARKATSGKRGPGRPKKASASTRGPGRPKKTVTASAGAPAKRGPGRPKKAATVAADPAAKRTAGRPKKSTAAKPATGVAKRPGRPRTKPVVPPSALQAIPGVGPAMAKRFEEAGVKTVTAFAKLSNAKMQPILDTCGPRYRNANAVKMQGYRDAAASVKK